MRNIRKHDLAQIGYTWVYELAWSIAQMDEQLETHFREVTHQHVTMNKDYAQFWPGLSFLYSDR